MELIVKCMELNAQLLAPDGIDYLTDKIECPTIAPDGIDCFMDGTDRPTIAPDGIDCLMHGIECPTIAPDGIDRLMDNIECLTKAPDGIDCFMDGTERPLNDKIRHSRTALIALLQQYNQGQNDFILMMQCLSTQERDEQIMRDIDDETKAVLSDILSLKTDEQRAHDAELSQLQDDVLYHINSQTDAIIHEIERIDSNESDSGVNVFHCDWHHAPPDSSAEDDDDNSGYGTDHAYDTDTEDGAEEHIDLIQSNMQLIAFLSRQSKTIVRLRKRILRSDFVSLH